jgi:hypothetical protein
LNGRLAPHVSFTGGGDDAPLAIGSGLAFAPKPAVFAADVSAAPDPALLTTTSGAELPSDRVLQPPVRPRQINTHEKV